MKKILLILSLVIVSCKTTSTSTSEPVQPKKTNQNYWQQHVDYTMNIDINVDNYQFTGTQKLVYTNNSPDDLKVVFYHLYFNAFQPGSEMDLRLQNITDPDGRMVTIDKKSRISSLKPNEIGYQKINTLKQDGQDVDFEVFGTILKVTLNKPIKAGTSTTFDMQFKAQVPVQIRRSGRDNKEGIALSMTQWYPKMAEYDFEGWHANAYIAREFHSVWGDFDVTINIDKNYILGGTGYLQNPNEIGYGYEEKGTTVKRKNTKKLAWHFKAPNVHDFTWAADKDYIHDILEGPNNIKMHFLYKNSLKKETKENWKLMQQDAVKTIAFFNKTVGDYPYKQYSVIQGGDGGMEYGMCTLITAKRGLKSLKGVVRHEIAHSWFQFALATNESKHPWMDEGFASYINTLVDQELDVKTEFPFSEVYKTYHFLAASDKNEVLTTHGDHYNTNTAYGINSYYKGQIFLAQLEYLIGKENVLKTLQKFYVDFKMKHPTPNDIIRTAEKISGVQLGWYLNEFVQTMHTIDYGIKSVSEKKITLERIGRMPMPIDLKVTYFDGTVENFYIPLRMMLGNKPTTATIIDDWAWAIPEYSFKTSKNIKTVKINISKLMADNNTSNDIYEVN
ncbi:MAG: M1 family metallopeptidase [Flavobacteriaceae bacterium]|nr:M1 family metallopeptidase [Flavobacteriaceae bacterium]